MLLVRYNRALLRYAEQIKMKGMQQFMIELIQMGDIARVFILYFLITSDIVRFISVQDEYLVSWALRKRCRSPYQNNECLICMYFYFTILQS